VSSGSQWVIKMGQPDGLQKPVTPFRSFFCLQVAAVVAQAMAQASGDAIIEVGASPAAEYEDIASQVAQALAGGEQEAAQEEEEEEEEAAAKPGGFFTIGGTQKKQAGGFFTLGGTQKRQVAPVEEEEEGKEGVAAPAPAPAKKAGGFFTLGGTQRRQVAPVAAVEEQEQEEGEPSGSYVFMLCMGG
jgi:hypothetical protein